eukprot:7382142-Prymnesium_polylepis.2
MASRPGQVGIGIDSTWRDRQFDSLNLTEAGVEGLVSVRLDGAGDGDPTGAGDDDPSAFGSLQYASLAAALGASAAASIASPVSKKYQSAYGYRIADWDSVMLAVASSVAGLDMLSGPALSVAYDDQLAYAYNMSVRLGLAGQPTNYTTREHLLNTVTRHESGKTSTSFSVTQETELRLRATTSTSYAATSSSTSVRGSFALLSLPAEWLGSTTLPATIDAGVDA